MRSPGDILLISCYELGHQPFHLASLHSMLRKAGYFPVSVDTAVETLTDQSVKQAKFVAISVPMHTALRLGQQLAKRVRILNPSVHICFYGLYASLNADYLLQDCADSTIGGEYEMPMLNLIASIESNEGSFIPGVSTREQISNSWIQRTSFVAPERNHLPSPDRYAHLELKGEQVIAGYTETTRGCKHTCLHCPITPIYNGRFFAIPADIVLADIRLQAEQGVRHITFGDPDFINGPTHALRIAQALHNEFPYMTFDATIKIEHLLKHRDLLPKFRDFGCAFIVSAVESINDDVLLHLDKGHTSIQVTETFDLMEKVGIPLRPSLMPFSPWETLESYISLLNFFEEHKLIEHVDPVHFSIRLLIPPGSGLLDTLDNKIWLGELDAAAYTYRWTHHDPRMDTLHQAVSTLVEKAQSVRADTIETFFHIKALALETNDQDICVSCAIRDYGKG
ncbi:MAG: CUAEP/CCAEP-tail radical SAM (seleno)protein, partial [Ktedonobacteraceae bacterium]